MKEQIYRHCLHLLNQKIEDLAQALVNVTEAGNNETKSTAGDKHETSRAMMQIEQEKLGKQLKEIQEQRSELEKIDISKSSTQITRGTLIQSDKGFFFLSIGLGKITVDGKTIFAISPQSPLGKLLLGKKEKDSVEMNGVRYTIEALY